MIDERENFLAMNVPRSAPFISLSRSAIVPRHGKKVPNPSVQNAGVIWLIGQNDRARFWRFPSGNIAIASA
jgi:hypothetical protein